MALKSRSQRYRMVIFLVVALAIVVMAAGILWLRFERNVPIAKITDVDGGIVPPGFPSGLAKIEPKAPIIFNYTAINSAGQNQVSRQVISSNTVAGDLVLYRSALTILGWEIMHSDTAQPDNNYIFAIQGSSTLTIHIFKDTQAYVRVDMSVILPPPK